MEPKILGFLLVALFCNSADAAVTGWTSPVIATASGTGTFATSIDENTAAGATSLTLVATGAAASGAYSIFSQTPSVFFTVDANTGILSLSASPNRDSPASVSVVVLQVVATDGTTPVTATVSILIGDVNDIDPACPASPQWGNVQDRACSGTNVGAYAVTDGDATSPNNQIASYSIVGGNTGNKFSISSAGLIYVTIGERVDVGDGDVYTLLYTATDGGTPSRTTTCTTTVYVCSAPTITISIITLFVALLASLR